MASYDVQVFPSYGPNAWAALRAPVSPAGTGVGLAEIAELQDAAPIFVSLDARPDTIVEIAEAVTAAGLAGLSFTLSDAPLGAYHSFTFPELESVLRVLVAEHA